jgi:hypothetical protein
MNETPLTECLGEGLLDRADQAGRPVGDDQQRGAQTALLQVLQEVVPGVGGLAAARGQADERGLAAGGDTPGSQDRLGRGAGVHPEEAGVQDQVVQRDAVRPTPRPGDVLVLELAADRRHRGLGDRGLIAQRLGQGRLDVANGQAAHERGNHQRLQRIGPGDMAAEQPGRERLGGATQLRPGQGHRSGGRLYTRIRTSPWRARAGPWLLTCSLRRTYVELPVSPTIGRRLGPNACPEEDVCL